MCAVFGIYLFLQLRVIRAFKSTLEDLEERRSVHSLRSSRSNQGCKPFSDMSFIDEDNYKMTHSGSTLNVPGARNSYASFNTTTLNSEHLLLPCVVNLQHETII
ncbi:hypothetical protein M8J76_013008 [Diaphorina citri]|jgi:hypothetical protein|nr:hypothetical protein M8J75_010725 [Diaphorina citri]KAI5727033.1 hypothetical protein M8J76_013008 [Diaphorina citri]